MAQRLAKVLALVALGFVASASGLSMCKNQASYLPDTVMETNCKMVGIDGANATCCGAGGDWNDDEKKCERMSRAACVGAGGQFEETKCISYSTIAAIYKCEDQVPGIGATAGQLLNHFATGCCSDGLSGCAPDSSSGTSKGLCLNSEAFLKDKVYELRCMGINQIACCGAGGKWEKTPGEESYCLKSGFCKFEGHPNAVEACASAGGTGQTSSGGTAQGETCSITSKRLGMLQCDDPFPQPREGMTTYRPFLDHMGRMCCDDGRSRCSSATTSTSNICRNPGAVKASTVFNYKCKGITSDQCTATLQGEWKIEEDDGDACAASGVCEVMGDQTTKCTEIGGAVETLTCAMLDVYVDQMMSVASACSQQQMMMAMVVNLCCSDQQSICTCYPNGQNVCTTTTTVAAADSARQGAIAGAAVVAGSAALALALYASGS